MTHTLALLLCFALVGSVAAAGVPAKIDLADLPAHPRLLMTAKGVAEMKDRVERCDWARAHWEAIRKKAVQELDKETALPPRGGNWFHWYACPEHGCSLSTGKQVGEWQWEHKCPVGGEIRLGDTSKSSADYDGCVISRHHDGWSRAMLVTGVAYQMTGDARYAGKCRDIALAYAEKYPTYPIHDNSGAPKLGARIGSQNLDESVWLIQVCQGLDLVWDTLTQAEREAITNRLLLPSAREVIMPHPHGVHNIQCWRNSAMGLVGLLVGDAELVNYAINNAGTGFRAQMEKGVTPDGCWYEGAWGYHFYTMSAIWGLTEAARNCGIDLYCPEYKRMFDAPLLFAMPTMSLPAFNDSGQQDLSGGSAIYELAYARYKDPVCLELLSRSDRRNDFALFFGEAKLPEAPKAEWKSANYPRSGYAILAKGAGEQATWLGIKYGPHGGGHGHPDKLSFVLCAKGRVLGIDPGTTRYGLPIQKQWHRTTLAHNTLTIDEESQKPAEGKCIAFGDENGVDYAVCDAGPIYDGVAFTRTSAVLNENLIVFIDQIKADKEHTFDLAYHQAGTWKDLPRGTAWTAPDKPGYMHLRDATTRATSTGIDLGIESSGIPITVGLAGGEAAEVITATGVGRNTTDRVPVAVFRTRGREAAVVWFISLDGKPARVERLGVLGGVSRADVTAVSVTSGNAKWIVVANPSKRAARVSLPDGSEWAVNSAFAVKP